MSPVIEVSRSTDPQVIRRFMASMLKDGFPIPSPTISAESITDFIRLSFTSESGDFWSNLTNTKQESLLTWLCRNHRRSSLIDVVSLLCDKGANVNYCHPTSGTNALIELIRCWPMGGDWKVLTAVAMKLIRKGTDCGHADATGDTAFSVLCGKPSLKLSETLPLFERLLRPFKVNKKLTSNRGVMKINGSYLSLLGNLVKKNEKNVFENKSLFNVTQLFMHYGVDLKGRTDAGDNALMLIAQLFFRQAQIVLEDPKINFAVFIQLFFKAGLNLNQLNFRRRNILNVLCCCARTLNADFIESIRLLVNHGVNEWVEGGYHFLEDFVASRNCANDADISQWTKVFTREDLSLKEISNSVKVLFAIADSVGKLRHFTEGTPASQLWSAVEEMMNKNKTIMESSTSEMMDFKAFLEVKCHLNELQAKGVQGVKRKMQHIHEQGSKRVRINAAG